MHSPIGQDFAAVEESNLELGNLYPFVNFFRLKQAFDGWRRLVESRDGKSLVSIARSSFLSEQEGYKTEIFEEANTLLSYSAWNTGQIGSGNILTSTIRAIEIDKNNLLEQDRGRRGDGAVDHKKLLEIQNSSEKTREAEQLLYELYKDLKGEAEVFDALVTLFGKRFPLLAFLFFIKDRTRFLPLRPEKFETAFKKLDCKLDLSGQCSWQKYQNFLLGVGLVRDFIKAQFERLKLSQDVSLLDAHTFLWMLQGDFSAAIWSQPPLSARIREVVLDPKTFQVGKNQIGPRSYTLSPQQRNELEFRNRYIGEQGEDIVVDEERRYLTSIGRSDLAVRVRKVSLENVSAGYDILSFGEDGIEKQIEVKTAILRPQNELTFFLSRNEFSKAISLENYYLYFVSGVDEDRPEIAVIRAPFSGAEDMFVETVFPGGTYVPEKARVSLSVKDI